MWNHKQAAYIHYHYKLQVTSYNLVKISTEGCGIPADVRDDSKAGHRILCSTDCYREKMSRWRVNTKHITDQLQFGQRLKVELMFKYQRITSRSPALHHTRQLAHDTFHT